MALHRHKVHLRSATTPKGASINYEYSANLNYYCYQTTFLYVNSSLVYVAAII